jgi:hypothetical protein
MGLVLQNKGGDDLTVSAGGDFKFSTKLASGSEYAVSVLVQPSEPAQSCSVSKGSGSVAKADVTDVAVACVTNEYKVGGSVLGLTGAGLVLSNNGGDDLGVSADGAFSFAAKLKSGAAYAVTIKTPPSGQTCTLKDATGNVGGGDVAKVTVVCLSGLTLQAAASFGRVVATWNNAGATDYDVYSYSTSSCDLDHFDACADGNKATNVTSPYTVAGLTNGKAYYFRVKGNYGGGVSVVSNQTGARPNLPVFDDDVDALATSANGTTYVGGLFKRLSVRTGAGVPLHRTTGLASEMPNFPILDGDVYAVAADSSGGFFVGGQFSRVDGIFRDNTNLIHIKADGTRDAAWDPSPNGTVSVLAVSGNTVYVAGAFTMIGGASRPGLAAIDMSGNATSWNPNPTPVGTYALAVAGDTVYVGGGFATIGGQARAHLAALVTDATGAAKTWNPNPDDDVVALAVAGDTVYAAGYFSNIGGQPRQRLGAVDASGVATSWDPNPNNAVSVIAVSGNTLYAAGTFTGFRGDGANDRNHLAALTTEGTGMVKAWNPDPGGNVVAMAVSGDTVYVGGDFKTIGGMSRNGLAAIDASGAANGWNPNPDGDTRAFAISGDSIYTGGVIGGMGGINRGRVVAFDASGAPTSWDPNADGEVHALAVGGETVYMGGDFTNVGGMGRNGIAAVDAAGGVTAWNPNANGDVQTLAVSGGTVYAGGAFTSIGGATRNRVAALDANGAATAWDPNASAMVRAFAFDGATVYVGGDFTTIGGTTRNRVAAIGANGAATSWDANASGPVRALAFDSGSVYVGGDFLTIGGAGRNRLAAIDAASGTATTWNPDVGAPVHALGFAGGRLYVAGEFTTIGLVDYRNHIAAFDAGALTTWAPNIEGNALALAFTSDAVKVGGTFPRVDGAFASRFASLSKSE